MFVIFVKGHINPLFISLLIVFLQRVAGYLRLWVFIGVIMVSFVDWLSFVLSKGLDEKKECIALVIWQIWNNRNSILWKGKGMPAAMLSQLGLSYLQSWKLA